MHKSKILKAPQGNLQSLKANIWILLNYWGSKFWNKCFSASCVRSKDLLCYRQIKCKAHVNSTMNKRSKESPALWLFTTIWEDCSFPCPVWKSDISLNSWEFKFHPIKSILSDYISVEMFHLALPVGGQKNLLLWSYLNTYGVYGSQRCVSILSQSSEKSVASSLHPSLCFSPKTLHEFFSSLLGNDKENDRKAARHQVLCL